MEERDDTDWGDYWKALPVIAMIGFFLGLVAGGNRGPGQGILWGLVAAGMLVGISLAMIAFAWVVGWPFRR